MNVKTLALLVAVVAVACLCISIGLFYLSHEVNIWVAVFAMTGILFGAFLIIIGIVAINERLEDLSTALKKLPTH